jgi:hypothetical protein
MALTDERRIGLLAYCKLTELADDLEVALLVDSLYEAAVGYLAGAGVSEPAEGTPRRAQYDLLINYLVLDGYNQRDMETPGTQVAENPVFRRTLNQLKLTEGMVSNLDTSTETSVSNLDTSQEATEDGDQ